MWIKICGNTSLEDALLAAELGADAIGFVFAPSVRQVTPTQAAAIAAQLPANLETVGVFSAWPAERIVDTVQQANLTTIQLHGNPDPELVRTLHTRFKGQVTIVQVVHWDIRQDDRQTPAMDRELVALTAMREVDRVLIDSKVGIATGGTGTPFDWNAAETVFAINPKTILAGGLNAGNIEDAIYRLAPWGVDVVSGVEASPGKKDRTKLQAFLQAARKS